MDAFGAKGEVGMIKQLFLIEITLLIILLLGCPSTVDTRPSTDDSDDPNIPPAYSNTLKSLVSSANNADKGSKLILTANLDAATSGTVFIDPDGEGTVFNATSFPFTTGDLSKSLEAIFLSPGIYTPQAWLDSDSTRVNCAPITINDIATDVPPVLSLKFGSISGGSDLNYSVYAGESFDVYIDAADDNSISRIMVYNSAMSTYKEISAGQIVNLENNVVADVMSGSSGLFLRVRGNDYNGTYGKTGTLSIKAKAVDNVAQESGVDEMKVALESAVASVNVSSTDSGSLSSGIYSTQHKADSSNIARLTDDATSNHDTVKWYVSTSLVSTTAKGGSLDVTVDYFSDRNISFELYKNGNLIAEGSTVIRGTNTAPEYPSTSITHYSRMSGTESIVLYLDAIDINNDTLSLLIASIDSARINKYDVVGNQMPVEILAPTGGWTGASEHATFKLSDSYTTTDGIDIYIN